MLRFIALILMLSIVGNAQSVHAQTDDTVAVELAAAEMSTALECFDYYSPSNITTNFIASTLSAAPNEIVTFSGVITNVHPYPLVDVNLHVKVFKRDEVATIAGFGDTLVEQIVAVERTVVPADGSKSVSYDWIVPTNAEGGAYYAVFFVTAAGNDFPVMGYTPADDMIFGQVDFTVVNDDAVPVVSFDRTTLAVNDVPYVVANPEKVSPQDSVTITIDVVNPTETVKLVPTQWNVYTYRTIGDDPILSSQTELIELAAGERKTLTYTLESAVDGQAYVTLLTQDDAAKEFVNLTIGRTGSAFPALEIPFAGLSVFPLQAQSPVTLFACINPLTSFPPDAVLEVVLRLTDIDGNLIHEYYTKEAASTVFQTTGFGETFTPTTDYRGVRLDVAVAYQGIAVLQSSMTYDCSIDESICEVGSTVTAEAPVTNGFPTILVITFLFIFVQLGVVVAVLLKKKKPRTPTMNPPASSTLLQSLVLLAVLSGFFMVPTSVDAQSCIPNGAELTQGDISSCCSGYAEWGTPTVHQWQYSCEMGICDWGMIIPTIICAANPNPPPPPPPSPSASYSLSGGGCSIVAGGSTCNGTVTWTTSNVASPNVRNNTTNTQYSTAPSGSLSALLRYGSNDVALRNSSTQLTNRTLAANCVSGTSWNGTSCAAPTPPPVGCTGTTEPSCSAVPGCIWWQNIECGGPTSVGNPTCGGCGTLVIPPITPPPPPPPSGNLTGTGCIIAVNQNTCTGRATWTIANATAPNAYNNNTGTQFSSSPTGNNVAVTLVFGPNNIAIRNGSTPIGYSTALTAACISGTTWNGSVCAAPVPPPPTATAFVTSGLCLIPVGQSSCTNTVTWTISNAPSPNLYNLTTGTVISNQANGTNFGIVTPFGGYTIEARNASSRIYDTFLTAMCASGTTWNGTICSTTPPSCTPDGLPPVSTSCCSGTSHMAVSCVGYSYFDAGSPTCFGTTICGLPPGPPPSPTISGNGCTIPVGASTCSGTATWNISNPASPNVRNTTTNTQYSTNATGNNQSVLLRQGSNTVVARNGTTILASTNLSANCASGSSWNGSICSATPICVYQWLDYDQGYNLGQGQCGTNTYDPNTPPPTQACTSSNIGEQIGNGSTCGGGALDVHWWQCEQVCGGNPPPPPPPLATYNLSGAGCTIPPGGNSCNGTVTWSTTNVTSPNVRNTSTGNQFSTNPSGSNVSVPLQQGVNTIALRNAVTTLTTTNLSANCAGGTTWNGSTCAAATPTINLTVNGQDAVTVSIGEPLTFSWTGTGVTGCTVWGGGTSFAASPMPDSRVFTATQAMDDTFSILCSGGITDEVTVSVRPQPTVTLLSSVNGGPFIAGPRDINPGDSVRLEWEGTNASSCTSATFNTNGALDGEATLSASEMPTPGLNRSYRVTCTGTGGSGDSPTVTITMRQLPNLVAILGQIQESTGYDASTGVYNSVIVNFGINNQSGTPITNNVPYVIRMVRSDGTSIPPISGVVSGGIAANSTHNDQRSFSNVPFGNYTIYLEVNPIPRAFQETIWPDNDIDVLKLIPPPTPPMILDVQPGRVVRAGTIVDIDWNIGATYPIDCELTGPVLNYPTYGPVTFTTISEAIGIRQAGPINAQSNYQLRCTEPTMPYTFPPVGIVVETVGSVEEI